MIARSAHTVNAGLTLSPEPVGTVEGVDLAATVERIADWGGNAELYLHFLGSGLAAAPVTAASARSLGVVAGWRSGVVDLRDEALMRVVELADAAGEAALGLSDGQLDAFVTQQATDPFAWPTVDQLVARIGGFSGFGGAWVAQPTHAEFVAPTIVAVVCGSERWSAYVDVFGSRVVRAEKAPGAPVGTRARALVAENSYLVDIVRVTS